MKNSLRYIKKIFKVLIWPIIFIIGQFFIQYVFVAIFNSKEKGAMDNNQFLEYIKTLEYQDKLNNYINSKTILIIVLTMLIYIPILYKVFKNYKKENNFKLKNIFVPILLGISISLIYNIILFYLNKNFNFTNKFEINSLPILVQIISSGICGPILEELIFRGIVYNKLKEFNKPIISSILCGFIFSFMHTNIIDAIYAFIISFVLIYLYDKYKSLKVPICMHIALNTTIILMFNIIIKNYLVFNIYLIIVSIIILIFIKNMYKLKNNT